METVGAISYEIDLLVSISRTNQIILQSFHSDHILLLFVKLHVPSTKIVPLDPVHVRICCRYHEEGLVSDL